VVFLIISKKVVIEVFVCVHVYMINNWSIVQSDIKSVFFCLLEPPNDVRKVLFFCNLSKNSSFSNWDWASSFFPARFNFHIDVAWWRHKYCSAEEMDNHDVKNAPSYLPQSLYNVIDSLLPQDDCKLLLTITFRRYSPLRFGSFSICHINFLHELCPTRVR
jgi:hypothetical protein